MKLTKLELSFGNHKWIEKDFIHYTSNAIIDIKDVLELSGVNAALDYVSYYDYKPFLVSLCKWVEPFYNSRPVNKKLFDFVLSQLNSDNEQLLDKLREALPLTYLTHISAGHALECLFLTVMAHLGRHTLKETAFSALTAFVTANTPDEQRPFSEYPKVFSALHEQGLANISNFIIDFMESAQK
jgi:hypothetical protein